MGRGTWINYYFYIFIIHLFELTMYVSFVHFIYTAQYHTSRSFTIRAAHDSLGPQSLQSDQEKLIKKPFNREKLEETSGGGGGSLCRTLSRVQTFVCLYS